MIGLVRRVRGKFDARCLVDGRLNKDGCRVSMADAPTPRLVVDFDKPGSPLSPEATRCDYLFIGEGAEGHGWIAPLELKRGRLRADQVARQLQAGASAAEKVIREAEPIRLRPVAVSGRTSKAERSRLRCKGNRVHLHGRAEVVRMLSCGDQLVKAFGS